MQMLFSVGLKQKISGCDIHYASGAGCDCNNHASEIVVGFAIAF